MTKSLALKSTESLGLTVFLHKPGLFCNRTARRHGKSDI